MAIDKPALGRPSEFTHGLATEICNRLATGETLRSVCRSDDMPPESTVRQWVLDDRDGFYAQYTRAREIGYGAMADELLEIADDSSGDVITDDEGNRRQDAEFVSYFKQFVCHC